MKSKAFIILSLFFLLAFILPVYAEDEVSLTEFPQQLATKFDITLFSARLLASMILLLLFTLPVILMTKNPLAVLIVGIGVFGVTIALGWMPVYLLAILTLLMAVMFADKILRKF